MNVVAGNFMEQDSVGAVLQQLRTTGWLPERSGRADFSACLPALVGALNIYVDTAVLCATLPHKKEQLSCIDLLNSLASLGYIGRPAHVNLSDIDERLLPCLFVPDRADQGAMVVTHRNGNEFSIFYGDSEETQTAELESSVAGTAYFFVHEKDMQDSSSAEVQRATNFSWFRTLLERFRTTFWQVFMLSVVLNTVSLATPLFMMLVYDRVIKAHSPESLAPLVMGAVLALISEWGMRSLRARSLVWFGARLDNIVSNKIFQHLLLMPPIFTERASVAAQIARIKAFERVRDFFTGALFLAIIELPFTVIILAAIAIIAGPVVWVPVVTAVLYMGLLAWVRPKFKVAVKLASRAGMNRQQISIETFEKMHSLRASGLTSGWFRQFRDLSGKSSLASFQASFLASILETIAHGLFVLSGMFVIVIGIEQIWQDNMTQGALVACIIMVWRVLGPFRTLCTSLPRYEQLQNSIEQVNRLMAITTERDEGHVAAGVGTLKGQVTLSRVGLRYTKDSDPVFSGLSIDIKPGQMVAVTGGNGAGKSTILKLINGLYRPQIGTVRIDGQDIRQLDAIELRQHIAYVPQSPHFFQGTIAENLRFAEPLASDDRLKTALHLVEAWEDISALPYGMETVIGGNHVSLPTMLAYRLNLARAYLKDTSLMLIDEQPYALLNSAAGASFRAALQSWKGERTIVMVTHREDYMKMADVSVLLRSGLSPLVGTPEKIIEAIYKSNEVI